MRILFGKYFYFRLFVLESYKSLQKSTLAIKKNIEGGLTFSGLVIGTYLKILGALKAFLGYNKTRQITLFYFKTFKRYFKDIEPPVSGKIKNFHSFSHSGIL